jgi:hypothetical protein
VNNSLLEIFDPANTEYAGVRDHFSTAELAYIDEWRTRAHPTSYTLSERIGIIAALSKAILTADNETS